MARYIDKNAQEIKQKKNLSSFHDNEVKRARAEEIELLELKMHNNVARFLVVLESTSVEEFTTLQKKLVQKLKDRLWMIIHVLHEPPISKPCYILLNELLKESGEEMKANGIRIESWKKAKEGKRGGYFGQTTSWVKELDIHPEWMHGVTRGNRNYWTVSADAIEAELRQLGYVDYDKDKDKVRPPNAIPSIRTINITRKNRKHPGR